MIPIRDTIKSRTFPFVTILLILANAAAFLYEARLGPQLNEWIEVMGAGAFLFQAASDPESTVPAIGASGAIAGVLGAYLILYPRSRVLTLVPIFIFPWFVEIPAVIYLGVWFLLQLANGAMQLSTKAGEAGGVAWWAHIGGFVLGIILCLLLRRPAPAPVYRTYQRRFGG